MSSRRRATLSIWLGFVLATWLGLDVLLLRANPPVDALGVADLSLATLWIALVFNALLALVLAAAWRPVRRLAGWAPADGPAYLASGLLALHAGWLLLNRLSPAQTWIRTPRILTLVGVAQLAALGLAIVVLVLAGVRFWRGRRTAAIGLLVLASGIVAITLAWNARHEVYGRSHSLAEIRRAAAAGLAQRAPPGSGSRVPAWPPATAGPASPEAGARVLVVGLDGLDWGVLVPLLEMGDLPHLATLVANGAIGVLDNGELSYSAPIWSTIFTGRPPSAHGIHEFRRPRLTASGLPIDRLPVLPPTLHTVFGLRHLFSRIPPLGRWRMEPTGALDLEARTFWDVAGAHGRRVLVTNPPLSLPVQPVRGHMIVLRDAPDPLTAWPPALAGEWQAARARADLEPRDWRSYRERPEALIDRARVEAAFARELFAREPFELGLYWDGLLDDLSHLGWDFHAGRKGLVWRMPERLDPAGWERLVREHVDHALFRGYRELDATLGGLMRQGPASFVVVSDHGWNYSGFEHYGSQDGVVILSAPAFRSGVDLRGARIEDVAPTVLALLGVPLSRELAGRPLLEAFAAPPEIRRVARYGPPEVTRRPTGLLVDAEERERLEALGYAQ